MTPYLTQSTNLRYAFLKMLLKHLNGLSDVFLFIPSQRCMLYSKQFEELTHEQNIVSQIDGYQQGIQLVDSSTVLHSANARDLFSFYSGYAITKHK